MRRSFFCLISVFASLAVVQMGDAAFAGGTGPDANNPEAVWDYCMQENIKTEVWHDKRTPEEAVVASYRTCRPEFNTLLASLPSEAAKTSYRAKVKAAHTERLAFGAEMIALGDPSKLENYDPPPTTPTEPPVKEAIVTAKAEPQSSLPTHTETPKPALKRYDPNKLFALETTVGCRWKDDLEKWAKLEEAGRRDLADQLDCIIVEKGAELLLIEDGFLLQAIPSKSDSATEYWFSFFYVANELSRAIRAQCPQPASNPNCSDTVAAQYTTEAN